VSAPTLIQASYLNDRVLSPGRDDLFRSWIFMSSLQTSATRKSRSGLGSCLDGTFCRFLPRNRLLPMISVTRDKRRLGFFLCHVMSPSVERRRTVLMPPRKHHSASPTWNDFKKGVARGGR